MRFVTTAAGSGRRGYHDGQGPEAEFDFPNDLVTDSNGNVFVVEFNNHTVRKITPTGLVSTFVGNGSPGERDGTGTQAQLRQPAGIAVDRENTLYVTEWTGHRIRKVTPQGVVTTLAGSGTPGFLDGPPTQARFNTPDGITVDAVGNLYVTEFSNHALRKIDPLGNVTTIVGTGASGFKDGDRAVAQFSAPGGILWLPSGSLLVTDTGNQCLRQVEFLEAAPSNQAALVLTLNPSLTIFGTPGKTYRIEAAEESSPTQFIGLGIITLTNQAGVWTDPQPATRRSRLYRAVLVE